ncbi:MAG TPA: alpha/beta family hydrolase [Mycobacteriales bacterium]
MPTILDLDTGRGPARATVHHAAAPAALVVLLHGAGTDTAAAPYPELADALAAAGLTAVRFDQPYRVAGRRAPDRARFLDAALVEALPALHALAPGCPLGVVGRSSGARVACRTAAAAGTRAIVALGFPWRPPGTPPRPDRGDELRLGARTCPVLVVQGERDPFGRPTRLRGVRTRTVAGMAHAPTLPAALGTIGWLARTLAQA